MKTVYLDYAATTPVDPRVADLMADCLTLDGNFANPASRSHRLGWQAEQAVEVARRQLADVIQADPRDIVWTSGATESINLALKGRIEYLRKHTSRSSFHLITSSIEHKATLDTCEWLATEGVSVTYVSPDADGLIDVDQIVDALTEDTVLVSLMAVNNELGTVTDIAAIGSALANHPAVLHVDAAQALGKIPVSVADWRADMVSFSAHKLYGPKGIGALYVRREPQVCIEAQMHGGGHERGMRSGTLPTHQIAGFGLAAALVNECLVDDRVRIQTLRDSFETQLLALGGVYVNGSTVHRTPNHTNMSFDGVDGEILLASLARIAVSSGSACTSASVEPSYVLKAIGRSNDLAHAGLRFSLGRFTTEEDIKLAVEHVSQIIMRLRR